MQKQTRSVVFVWLVASVGCGGNDAELSLRETAAQDALILNVTPRAVPVSSNEATAAALRTIQLTASLQQARASLDRLVAEKLVSARWAELRRLRAFDVGVRASAQRAVGTTSVLPPPLLAGISADDAAPGKSTAPPMMSYQGQRYTVRDRLDVIDALLDEQIRLATALLPLDGASLSTALANESLAVVHSIALAAAARQTVAVGVSVFGDADRPACKSLVFGEVRALASSPSFVEVTESPLLAFNRALSGARSPETPTRPAGREPELLAQFVLTDLQRHLLCVSTAELVALENAWAQAWINVLRGLATTRRVQLARSAFDRILPPLLLLFDATKYVQLPASEGLLRAGILASASTNDLEVVGLGTLVSSLVVSASGGTPERGTLSRMQVWLADPTNLRKLRQVRMGASSQRRGFSSQTLLTMLTDLARFGEGECSLFEFIENDFSCASDMTCKANEAAAADLAARTTSAPRLGITTGTLGITVGGASLGATFGRPAASALIGSIPVRPDPTLGFGGLRSSHTRLGIPRAALDTSHCRGGLGAGAPPAPSSSCASEHPQAYSDDPAMQQAFSCAMQGSIKARNSYNFTTFSAEASRKPSRFCMAGFAGDKLGKTPEPPAANAERDTVEKDHRVAVIATGLRAFDRTVAGTSGTSQALDYAGLTGERRALAAAAIHRALERAALFVTTEVVDDKNNMARTDLATSQVTVNMASYWANDHEGFYAGFKEGAHVAMNTLRDGGFLDTASAALMASSGGQHSIVNDFTFAGMPMHHHNRAGESCSDNQACSNACGVEDAALSRMISCVASTARRIPVAPLGCLSSIASCSLEQRDSEAIAYVERLSGGFICGPASVDSRPDLCQRANVVCGGEGGTPGGLYAACCAAPPEAGASTGIYRDPVTGCGPTQRPPPGSTTCVAPVDTGSIPGPPRPTPGY